MNRQQNETQNVNSKIVTAALAAFVAAFTLTAVGCNTTEGVGKDVKSLGAGIEEAADDAKD